MNCFPCFQSQRSKKSASKNMTPSNENEFNSTAENQKDQITQVENGNIAAQTFTFRELATATKNFHQECLLGEGGFGRVYKGMLKASGEVVAVKQLDRNGLQGNKEFLVEVFMLSLLHHQNLVNLIGYCADGDQRLLVFDFVPGGSLDYHLLDTTTEQKPLDWKTRMKIAYGAAKGLEYLHDKANPPVIYRDLKSSNILLDEEFNAKLSEFGLGKFGHAGDKMPVQSRVMGTYGYCAPEYARSGHLTTKSDVYSFGVVLLELITGRRAIDTTKPIEEQNLVAWAQPIFRDPKKFPDMADPRLNKQFPVKSLNQAVAIAAMCLQEEAAARPLMSDVVTTLSFLKTAVEEIPAPVTPPVMNEEENEGKNKDPEGSEKDQDQESSDHEDGESENHSDDEDPDGNSSDYTDSDSSVYEDEGSEDGHQQTVAESNKWSSKSSRKSSRRSQDRRVSSGHKYRSDESVSSSDTSSRVSRDRSLNQTGIKKYFSLSRKSSKGSKDGSVSLGHMSSMKSSIFSLSHKSSKISQDGNASLSHNSSRGSPSSRKSSLRLNSSKGSHDGRGSLSHKSSMRSQNESIMFDHNSSGKSHDGDVCLEHDNSRGSWDGSVYSS